MHKGAISFVLGTMLRLFPLVASCLILTEALAGIPDPHQHSLSSQSVTAKAVRPII